MVAECLEAEYNGANDVSASIVVETVPERTGDIFPYGRGNLLKAGC